MVVGRGVFHLTQQCNLAPTLCADSLVFCNAIILKSKEIPSNFSSSNFKLQNFPSIHSLCFLERHLFVKGPPVKGGFLGETSRVSMHLVIYICCLCCLDRLFQHIFICLVPMYGADDENLPWLVQDVVYIQSSPFLLSLFSLETVKMGHAHPLRIEFEYLVRTGSARFKVPPFPAMADQVDQAKSYVSLQKKGLFPFPPHYLGLMFDANNTDNPQDSLPVSSIVALSMAW